MSGRGVRVVAVEEREVDARRIARDAEHVATAGQSETAAARRERADLQFAMADGLRDREEDGTDE